MNQTIWVKSLLFMAILAVSLSTIPAVYARVPPDMPLEDQMPHPDSFIEIVYQMCRESYPYDVEICVELITNIDEPDSPSQIFESKPNDGCGYLILENYSAILACN